MNEGKEFYRFRNFFNDFKGQVKFDRFTNHIDKSLQTAKLFCLDDKQKNFFITGKVKVKQDMKINLPYPKIFFDVNFTKEELAEYDIKLKHTEELIGIMVTDGYVYPEKVIKAGLLHVEDKPELSIGKNLRFTLLLKYKGIKENEEVLQFHTFFKNPVYHDDTVFDDDIGIYNAKADVNSDKLEDYSKKFKEDIKKDFKPLQDFSYKFFLNLIRFVNYPDVILKEHKRTEANIKRRIKKGKLATPEFIEVQLTGEIQRYVDNVYEKPKRKWHYNYCFDVKGHPRMLTSPRYKEPKEIWIKPYEKGEGKKVESIYKIKRKQEKCTM